MAGIYIHIPFCRSKCAYCDFFSTPDAKWMHRYVDALINEAALRLNEIGEQYTTLYLGGGTPSLLSDDLLRFLFDGLSRFIDISKMEEVTLEANPEDITPCKTDFFQSLGINRISIGIQSFNDTELQSVSRKHAATDSFKALDALNESGINYSADLIYGLPGQNKTAWERNLDCLLSYAPPHFSAYLLSYEPGTKLYAQLMRGVVAEASDILAHSMYSLLCDKASAAGYNHYEVSNFALPGKTSIHNSAYWHYAPYLGLGAAAHSFDGKVRRFNPGNIRIYIDKIENGMTAYSVDDENPINRFNDYVITSLRTNDGFDIAFARQHFTDSIIGRFINNVSKLPDGAINQNNSGNYVIPERQWLTSDAVLRELILD